MRGRKTRIVLAIAAVMVVTWSGVAIGANGDAIRAGQTTTATNTTNLTVTESGNAIGFFVQLGGTSTGPAVKGTNNGPGNGISGVANDPNAFGNFSQNNAASRGTGAGGIFDGGQNDGVRGITKHADGFGGFFRNQTTGVGTSGVGAVALGRDHTLADLGVGPDGFDGAIEAAGPNGIEGNSTSAGGFGVSGDGPAVGVNGTATDPSGRGGNFTGGSAGIGVDANGGLKGVEATGSEFGVDADVSASGAVAVRGTAGLSANDAVQGFTSNAIGDAVQATASGSAAFALFGIGSGPDGATGLVAVSSSGDGARVSTSDAGDQALQASNTADNGVAGLFVADRIGIEVDMTGGLSTFGIGVNADVSGDSNGDADFANDGHNALTARTDDANADNTLAAFGAVAGDEFTAEAIEAFGFVDINGNARVTGNLDVVGTCCGPMMDHPLDPQNKVLRHATVSSPDMMNIYDGNVTTGADGMATVELPVYFGALNKDFRYQLTVIGRTFAQAIVWQEIPAGGRTFQIRTSEPGVKVSWQVTGIRKDAFANANRIQVVENKTGAAKGKYLHPELFGKGTSFAMDESHSKAPAGAASSEDDLDQVAADYKKAAKSGGPSPRAPSPPSQPNQG